MYGKLFDSMYDGTISANWQALVTFQQMIILCDADGTIDITPPALARRTGIPLEIIEAGIEYLESPDPYSRTPDFDGRRILRIDEHRPWGWTIVNHAYYKHLQDAETVREQTRKRVARHREKNKEDAQNVTDGNGRLRHTDTDTDKTYTRKFDDFWCAYPKKKDKQRAHKSFNRLTTEDQESATLDVQKRQHDDPDWLREDGRYIPNPTTYLNGRRWEDEWKPAPTKVDPYETTYVGNES